MSIEKYPNRTKIYVALIGLFGVLTTAFISNWSKIFPNNKIDETEISEQLDDLIGKWYYYAVEVDGKQILHNGNESCGKDYIQFLNNGYYKNIDIWECEEDVEDIGKYSIYNDILKIQYEDTLVKINFSINEEILQLKAKIDFYDVGKKNEVVSIFTKF